MGTAQTCANAIDDANDAEEADAADFGASGDMPTGPRGESSHAQTACEPASEGRGGSMG